MTRSDRIVKITTCQDRSESSYQIQLTTQPNAVTIVRRSLQNRKRCLFLFSVFSLITRLGELLTIFEILSTSPSSFPYFSPRALTMSFARSKILVVRQYGPEESRGFLGDSRDQVSVENVKTFSGEAIKNGFGSLWRKIQVSINRLSRERLGNWNL